MFMNNCKFKFTIAFNLDILTWYRADHSQILKKQQTYQYNPLYPCREVLQNRKHIDMKLMFGRAVFKELRTKDVLC